MKNNVSSNKFRQLCTCLLLSALLSLSVFLTGCQSYKKVTLEELNSDSEMFLGEKVEINGVVAVPINAGTQSGFTLRSEDHSILVASEGVPEKNTEVIVKGIIVRSVFSQKFVFAEKVIAKNNGE